MMPSENQIRTLVSRLNELTQDGEVRWTSRNAPSSLTDATEDRYPYFFCATHKDKVVAVYERRYLTWNNEVDAFIWDGDAVFAVFDQQLNLLIDYPNLGNETWNLIRTVRNQVSDIDDYLDEVLGEE